jgi:hypothetical protein
MRLTLPVTMAGSGAPTGGSEGASEQGANHNDVCVWLTLPVGSIVMVVTVLVYVTLQRGVACTSSRASRQ